MEILYIDIETCPVIKSYYELPEAGKQAFSKKFLKTPEVQGYLDELKASDAKAPKVAMVSTEVALSRAYDNNAALYAEYSRIVCIGVGMTNVKKEVGKPDEEQLVLKIIDGEEVDIINSLNTLIASIEKKGTPLTICAHNGKNFDYPFMVRRMLILGITPPPILNVIGKKPWEVNLIDTVDLWKVTDMKYYVSLITLCYVFGVPSPKEEITGAQVPQAFWDGRIKEIGEYCLRDVHALVNVHRRMLGQSIIEKAIISTKK